LKKKPSFSLVVIFLYEVGITEEYNIINSALVCERKHGLKIVGGIFCFGLGTKEVKQKRLHQG
jgi:hypothetical protein